MTACADCNNVGWVCEDHPEIPWQDGESCCGGAGVPCACNPIYRIDNLQAENEKLKTQLSEAAEKLADIKSYGTDECPECVSEHGHAPMGHQENRIGLFYFKSEHGLHKVNVPEHG